MKIWELLNVYALSHKIMAIKKVREITNLGLNDSKYLVEMYFPATSTPESLKAEAPENLVAEVLRELSHAINQAQADINDLRARRNEDFIILEKYKANTQNDLPTGMLFKGTVDVTSALNVVFKKQTSFDNVLFILRKLSQV